MGANMKLFYIKKLKMQEFFFKKITRPSHQHFLLQKLDKLFFYTIFIINNNKQKGKTMAKTTKKSKKNTISTRVLAALSWPFKKVWQYMRWAWNQLANINVVALLNLALLISIIVLFSLLIIDLRKSANANGYEQVPQTQNDATSASQKQMVRPRSSARKITTLPIKRDPITRKPISEPIQVAKISVNPVAVKQIAVVTITKKTTNVAEPIKKETAVMGDVVIDNHDMTKVLSKGTRIKGNLYLQDLRKYTLPCDIVIEGNLIVRDVNQLNFCGDFSVCGNIYVNHRSSFGPVPSTARIGGKIIM